ncbi:hypothetical protein [Glutamicibacter soli]|uniref:hypothetical protein n=1 Tax=Glutamicibacter soli TaxID=453836 RepID=UPI003FD0AFE5
MGFAVEATILDSEYAEAHGTTLAVAVPRLASGGRMNRIDVRWNVREQCAELVVDGRSLEEIVDPERAWGCRPLPGDFCAGR